MLHVLGPFRREGGIERDFLAAHAATGARFIGVHGGVPPLVDEADEGRRRHRPGEQETLHRVATRLPQPRKAVGCFHTLGYHLHAQPVRELDHRPHDSLVTGIIREPGDKGLVDFQCGDGAAFQMLQAGIAGAEVVGGEAHADGAQGVETGEQGWIAECDRFGQLDLGV